MMVPGDIYHIAERICEVYPDLFLTYDARKRHYVIWRRHETVYGDRPQRVLVWSKPLDARLIHHLRYTDASSGHRDILREIEESEQASEQRFDRCIEELAQEATKDVLEGVRKLNDRGNIISTAA